MFGKEAALFCPSGTMTNQIAIKIHTRPGDELLCADSAHVYVYEGGGIAFNSGVLVYGCDHAPLSTGACRMHSPPVSVPNCKFKLHGYLLLPVV
jgi:hypothetical protein